MLQAPLSFGQPYSAVLEYPESAVVGQELCN